MPKDGLLIFRLTSDQTLVADDGPAGTELIGRTVRPELVAGASATWRLGFPPAKRSLPAIPCALHQINVREMVSVDAIDTGSIRAG